MTISMCIIREIWLRGGGGAVLLLSLSVCCPNRHAWGGDRRNCLWGGGLDSMDSTVPIYVCYPSLTTIPFRYDIDSD